jgi:uncharacterized protein (DUF2249 family)
MPAETVTLDVREDLRAGREPFPRIMAAVSRLREGEQLRVIAPFEPRPLIGVLAAQGFVASVTQVADGSFEAIFTSTAPLDSGEDLLP